MKLVRWLVVLVAGVIGGVAGLHAVRAGLSGDALLQARINTRVWKPGEVPPLQAWTQSWEALQEAVRREPGNPAAHESLGLLAVRRYDDPSRQEEATAHYLKAIALRPVTPTTWANLADARYLVGDTSKTFQVALESAARLGPADPYTQRVVAYHGLAVYEEMGTQTRSAIEAMVGAGMRRDPGEMLAIAHRRGRLDVACRFLPEAKRKVEPAWQQVCAQAVVAKRDASGERH